MAYETVIYQRDRLYEQVWASPVRDVAKEYGITDVALAKICRKLDVPLPGRGYWARKAAGEKLKQPPLAKLKAGAQTEIRVNKWRSPVTADRLPEEVKERLAKEDEPEAKIVVSPSLDDAHELIARSAKILRKRKAVDGVVSCRDVRCVHVVVAPASLDRALRIMDSVFKALETRGYDVEVTEPEVVRGSYDSVDTKKQTETRVRVGEEWLSFSLVEQTELDPPTAKRPKFDAASREELNAWYSRPRQVRKPTGRLTLHIDTGSFLHTRGSWNDTAKRSLDDCLNDFIRGLLTRAEAVRLNRLQNEERARQWKEQREQQEREQRRREEDARRASEIEAELAAWRLARDIRAYVTELYDVVAKGDCTITPDGAFDRKLKWALEHAEKIDPVASLQREVVAMHARHKETCDACREGREHDHKREG